VCHVPERASPFAAVEGSPLRPAPRASPGRPNGSSSCLDFWGLPSSRLTAASLSLPFGPSRSPGTTASADFSLRSTRHPFRRQARPPQVRTSTFRARPPDLRRLPLVAGASRSRARSPQEAPPRIRFLFVGPLLSLCASSRHPLAGMPLRFAQVGATSSLRDSHPVADGRAGRTRKGETRLRRGSPGGSGAQERPGGWVERTRDPPLE